MRKKLTAMFLTLAMILSLITPAMALDAKTYFAGRDGGEILHQSDLSALRSALEMPELPTEEEAPVPEEPAAQTGEPADEETPMPEEPADSAPKAPGEEAPAENPVVTQQEAIAFVFEYAGLQESQLGAFPDDYLSMAESVNLTDGITLDPTAPCTVNDMTALLNNCAPLYDALHADAKKPLFINGAAQPIFEFDNVLRFFVWVETNYDTDQDGELDLAKALIQIPKEVIEDGTQVATIFEARPYITGMNPQGVSFRPTGEVEKIDIRTALYDQPAPRTPSTEEKGSTMAQAEAESADPKYYDFYEDLDWYDYFLVRGFAVVECGGIGTLDSEGFETCGSDLEIDAFKCVIEWLTGDRVAYTDKTSNIPIEADWSNGNVGMTGRSYAGTTQFGLATTGVKGLKTIVPVAGIASWYEYTNSQGVATSSIAYTQGLANYCNGRRYGGLVPSNLGEANVDEAVKAQRDYETVKTKYDNYYYSLQQEQLDLNGDYGDTWAIRDYTKDWQGIQIPALIVHGLNDTNVRTKEFDLMYRAYTKAGQNVKLLLHQGTHLTPTYPATSTKEARYAIRVDGESYDEILNRWFCHYLYGVENGAENMSPVTAQSNLDGSWHTYDSWQTASTLVRKASDATTDATTTLVPGSRYIEYTYDFSVPEPEDFTVKGPIAVHIRAATTNTSDIKDGIGMYVQLIDNSDESFMAFVPQGSYLPLNMIKEQGAWMGGGLTNYHLEEYRQTATTSKNIGTGYIDLYNPTAGYDSASAAQRTELVDGTYYDYTVYLQPNLYTVKAGHQLSLYIMVDYDIGRDSTIVIDNSATYVSIPVHAPNSGGGSTGGGGGSGGGGTTGTTTNTTTNPDGSTTTTVTDKATGKVTETTKFSDGRTQVVETGKDGTVKRTVTAPDGSKLQSTTNPDGSRSTTEERRDGTRVESATTADGRTTATVAVPTGKSAVTVTIPTPAQPRPGEVAVIVKADGTREVVKTSVATAQGMQLTLSKGAALEIVDNSKQFADVRAGAWYADSVSFAASRELFNGTGGDTFAPEAPMTRAMLWTVLYRFNGEPSAEASPLWYGGALTWVTAQGISDGTDPGGNITREQLAATLYRFAGSPEVSGASLNGYADAGSVSTYAERAMLWAVDTGLIQGSGGKLMPQGEAGRAQVAAILQRYVESLAQ